MPYNLVEAGAATGKSRSTILRAIRRGILSATRDAASSGWLIEPAELHRVYSPVAPSGHDQVIGRLRNHDDHTLNGELRELRARLDDKDALIAAHQAAIEDLRNRLTASEHERREQAARIVALLTDQRPAALARRAWWRWGRRG